MQFLWIELAGTLFRRNMNKSPPGFGSKPKATVTTREQQTKKNTTTTPQNVQN